MNKNIKITSVYKDTSGKVKMYGIHGYESIIVTKEQLMQLAASGVHMINAYVRGNIIVLKNNVVGYKYASPVKVKWLHSATSTFEICKFDAFVTVADLNETMLHIIKVVDNAVPIGDIHKSNAFTTPFGVCSMNDLSAGCKVALWAYYCGLRDTNTFVNVTSMGINALKCLIQVIQKENLDITLGMLAPSLGYNRELDDVVFYDVVDKVYTGYTQLFIRHMEVVK